GPFPVSPKNDLQPLVAVEGRNPARNLLSLRRGQFNDQTSHNHGDRLRPEEDQATYVRFLIDGFRIMVQDFQQIRAGFGNPDVTTYIDLGLPGLSILKNVFLGYPASHL